VTRRAVLFVLLPALLCLPACANSSSNEIRCGRGSAGVLAAQAVPSATYVPCIIAFPVGWSYGGFAAETGSVRFWLDSDRAGPHAVQVELTPRCDTTGAAPVESSAPAGVREFELLASREPAISGSTFLTFAGGCVTMRYDFDGGAPSSLLVEVRRSIELFPRDRIVTLLEDGGGLLCGAGAPPCAGETGP
jgi:hypothetical protein